MITEEENIIIIDEPPKDEFGDNIIVENPTLHLNMRKYKVGHIIYVKIPEDIYDLVKHRYTCSCGKFINEYYKLKAIKTPKGSHSKKEWRYYGYPRVYCHCKCGKKFGEHITAEERLIIKRK